jgi:hypothetical protein
VRKSAPRFLAGIGLVLGAAGLLAACSASSSSVEHRATGSTCASSTLRPCTTDMDCAGIGFGQPGPPVTCVDSPAGKVCGADQCATDADCAPGSACVCLADVVIRPPGNGSGGLRPYSNQCLPADCRVDSDCGDHGACSPTKNLYCSVTIIGYQCHTCEDSCVDDADCEQGSYCVFAPEVGKWACTAGTCAG